MFVSPDAALGGADDGFSTGAADAELLMVGGLCVFAGAMDLVGTGDDCVVGEGEPFAGEVVVLGADGVMPGAIVAVDGAGACGVGCVSGWEFAPVEDVVAAV